MVFVKVQKTAQAACRIAAVGLGKSVNGERASLFHHAEMDCVKQKRTALTAARTAHATLERYVRKKYAKHSAATISVILMKMTRAVLMTAQALTVAVMKMVSVI